MTTPKRMALAFGCMLLAFAIFALWGIVPTATRYGLRYVSPTFEILPVYLFFTLPGWVLALPFIIVFKNANGWRTWAMLAIGTAIGPCFLLGWTLLEDHRINWRGNNVSLAMSLFIGSLTTVFYVLLLRRFTRKAPPN